VTGPSPTPSSDRSELLLLVAALQERNAALEAQNATLLLQHAELKEQVRVLTERVDELERENAELKRKITGRTTERTGPKPRKDNPREKNDAAAQKKRRERREERKKQLREETRPHPLDPAVLACCPECAGGPLTELSPECSVELEWVPGYLKRVSHERGRGFCDKCKSFFSAPAAPRVVDGGLYGPGFISRVVVQKLLDCVPLYRQVKAFKREGLHVARSTLVGIFHLAASLIEPIYLRMMELVPESRVVYADETSLKMQRVKKLAYIWTFATTLFITYVFSATRAGATAEEVLGDSSGVLVVDGYTGYNKVTVPGKRTRAGCSAHARRKFANIDDDGAKQILEMFKPIWAVEREAKELGIKGTDKHLEMRRARAGPAMRDIKTWCEEHKGEYPPKSAVGGAIRYFTNQWTYLTRFLDDAEVEPDNNLSERLLRAFALGRKNWLFVGHKEAGRNCAMLASVLATCVLHGVNPQKYLADVLIRVQTHPASAIDDLLPHRWKALFGEGADQAA